MPILFWGVVYFSIESINSKNKKERWLRKINKVANIYFFITYAVVKYILGFLDLLIKRWAYYKNIIWFKMDFKMELSAYWN